MSGYLLLVEIIFLAVLCSELCTVSGDQGTTNKIEMLGNFHRFSEYLFDSLGVQAGYKL